MNSELHITLNTCLNKLSTSLRILNERNMDFARLQEIDIEEAITNIESACDNVLENIHSTDEIMRKLRLISNYYPSIKFLTHLRNIRHHNPKNSPFSLTNTLLNKNEYSEWYSHEIIIDKENYKSPMVLAFDLTNLPQAMFALTKLENSRLKQSHIDKLFFEIGLEKFIKNYRAISPFSLDIQPLIIKSLSLLLPPIKKNGLDKNLLFDSATYVNFFMNMKSCELRNIKILTSVN